MDKEYQFFVCNNKSRWSEGISQNIEITDDGIKLTSSTEYVFKNSHYIDKTLQETFKSDSNNKVQGVSVLKDGETYILDTHNCVWRWSNLNKQLHKVYISSHLDVIYKQILVNKDIIVLFSGDHEYIKIIDIETGQIIRDVELKRHIAGEVIAIEMTDDYLYLVHHKLTSIEVLSYEIKSGALAIYSETFESLEFGDNNLDTIKCLLKHTKNRLYLAVVFDDETIFIDELGQRFTLLTNSNERLLDYLPVEDGYYISMFSRKSDNRPVTSLYRTNSLLEIIFTIKDTYGVGNGLYLDETGMYQWFNDNWCLNHFELGEVYLKNNHVRDNIVTGHYISKCFDSYYENENWHRYLLDFFSGINTRIKINYYATDENRMVYNNRKLTISEFMNSSELTFEEKKERLCSKSYFKSECLNCKDGLFQNTKGRYLWFYIELIGTTASSPMVKSIQMYYKRQSYLRYLPEVYQQDKQSSAFLERFLSIFESYLSDMEESIDNIHKSFEPDLNSGDSLRWISTWLGLELDNSWTDDQIKRLIKVSAELYKFKGTKTSIETILEIYLYEKPYIIESFDIKKEEKQSDSDHNLYGDNPFTFYVLVSKLAASSKVKIANIMNILKLMKPAHTEAKLIILENTILLGDHSYLGMNTALSGYSSLKLNNQTYLLNDTVIYDVIEEDRIGKDARLDRETYLK